MAAAAAAAAAALAQVKARRHGGQHRCEGEGGGLPACPFAVSSPTASAVSAPPPLDLRRLERRRDLGLQGRSGPCVAGRRQVAQGRSGRRRGRGIGPGREEDDSVGQHILLLLLLLLAAGRGRALGGAQAGAGSEGEAQVAPQRPAAGEGRGQGGEVRERRGRPVAESEEGVGHGHEGGLDLEVVLRIGRGGGSLGRAHVRQLSGALGTPENNLSTVISGKGKRRRTG